MKRKSMQLSTIVVMGWLFLGAHTATVAVTQEECMGMGMICGNCNVLVETVCSYGPFILADCNGEGTTGTVIDVYGGSYGYVVQNQSIGAPCWGVLQVIMCMAEYTYECNGTTNTGYEYWAEPDKFLCGDTCYYA